MLLCKRSQAIYTSFIGRIGSGLRYHTHFLIKQPSNFKNRFFSFLGNSFEDEHVFSAHLVSSCCIIERHACATACVCHMSTQCSGCESSSQHRRTTVQNKRNNFDPPTHSWDNNVEEQPKKNNNNAQAKKQRENEIVIMLPRGRRDPCYAYA